MKKLLAVILAVIMTMSVIPFAASAEGFNDVPEDKWYSNGISYCVANGFMAGVADGHFDRSGTLTRAMFVTILAQLDWANTELYANEQIFTDVAPGKWYSGAINWAYSKGLASGLGDGTFGYKNPVTREQMAVFLFAYVSYIVEDMYKIDMDYIAEASVPYDLISRADLSTFSDSARIHSWASDAMSWAVAVGLFTGTTATTLDPRGNCTRAQAAVLIYALCKDVLNTWCDHEGMVEATCSTPMYCPSCDLTGGYKAHTYNEYGVCTVCESRYDDEWDCGHVFVNGSCEEPAFYCLKCGFASEEIIEHIIVYDEEFGFDVCTREFGDFSCGYANCHGEHQVIAATCTYPAWCEICYSYIDDPLGHSPENGVCTRCGGEYDAEYDCVHEWSSSSCTTYENCWLCGKRGAPAYGHDYDSMNVCRECGYFKDDGHYHFWNAPLCYEGDNYCLVCGIVPERTEHNYDASGLCTECYTHKPCETHTWVPATCKDRGYCYVCYAVNPDEPNELGHDFNEETHICSRCNLFMDWSLPNYERIKKNIQLNGISLPDGSLAISDEFEEGTLYIFMRPNNDDDFFVQLWLDEVDIYGFGTYSGMVEIIYDETPEVDFNMDISSDGEFLFSAAGQIDEKKDENFDGIDYSECITLGNVYNESELSDEELFGLVCKLISRTMVNAGTTASNKLDTNFDPDI